MKTATASSPSGTPETREDPAGTWRERSARLYEDLRRPARAMIRRAFGSAFGDDEIEDVYGNAWLGTLRALERRHTELSDEEVRKYVLTAVAHHASKELRRRGRKPTAPLDHDAGPIADGGDSLDERVAGIENSRIARDLLATLPPRRRAVMLLRYGWGLEPTQVCRLVKGLSARAYRKEITRGVDELTEKLRLVERGEWCADREPVLKAFAAGLADDDQKRQARHHLAHCRHCTDFVGRLSGHLHDLGSSVVVPSAAAATLDGRVSVPHRLWDLAHRARETLSAPFARDGDLDAASQVATGGGGVRGASAAGGGALAKLGSSGLGAKLISACLAGAAGGCIVAGVVPGIHSPGFRQHPSATASHTRDTAVAHDPPMGPVANPVPVTAPSGPDPATTTPPTGPVETTSTTTTTTTTQVAPPPPVAAEFGVEPSVQSSGPSRSAGSDGGGTTPAQREFGP